MSYQGSHVTTAVACLGAITGAYCAYHVYKQFQKPKLPTEWKQVGTLKDLYIYPIKSCGSLIMNEAECSILGLKSGGWLKDRFLMVVDAKNNFITARQYPELLLVHPTVRNSILTLKHNDMEPVHVDLAEIQFQKSKPATVWGVTVLVYVCGTEAGKWFSRLLNKADSEFRLVYYASLKSRPWKHSINKYYKFTKEDTGTLTDEAPFHIINEASVEDLNRRLGDSKVTHRNFRPNFVLSGAKPYEEDNWKFVKIGENIFEIIKPCTRCLVTTLDPETGARDAKTEPLETLRSYRQIENPVERKIAGNAPRMGVQLALRSEPGGIVNLHDAIYVA